MSDHTTPETDAVWFRFSGSRLLKELKSLSCKLERDRNEKHSILEQVTDRLEEATIKIIKLQSELDNAKNAFSEILKITGEDDQKMTEEDWNSFGEYHLRQDINEWEEWMEKRAKADEELQKLVTSDPIWQKPLSTINPIPNTTSP